MCGLAGFLDLDRGSEPEALRSVVMGMADRLHHRGPDDRGAWVDAAAGIALGFRRLAILDLSPEGHQPMRSAFGRYVLAFNGEIYNFAALQRELDEGSAGPRPLFRGRSDTEVMLAAIEHWGLARAVRRFVGMFAFVVWDCEEQVLHLVRDRLGEKPLYYGWMGNTFLFGSELKALRAHPTFRADINNDVLGLYLRHSYIPAPYTIYKGIFKLPPGTILTIKAALGRALPAPVPYWSARDVAEAGTADPFKGDETEAAGHLDRLLREAIRQQMVADVPLGAFLSGGVDSSTVVALMQAQSARPVKTFTIGFEEDGYNEARYAKAVAEHLGTQHTELYVTPAEVLDVIPKLPALYDEPFADSSQIPTFLISQLARGGVTVSLSGDGGDELFAGYERYFRANNCREKIRRIPQVLRQPAASALLALSVEGWDRALQVLLPILPARLRRYAHGDKVHKLAELITLTDKPECMYQCWMSKWNGCTPVLGAAHPVADVADNRSWRAPIEFIHCAMYTDLTSYLPNDILTKVDRASMGVSLEARAPFLDHRVVEFAWRVPMAMKVRNSTGKWLLRQVLYRYVPPALIERPKMGFCVPIDSWLRGPLREWAGDHFNEQRLRADGLFDPAPLLQKWQEHLSGCRNWQHHLWDVLMFQAWQEAQ